MWISCRSQKQAAFSYQNTTYGQCWVVEVALKRRQSSTAEKDLIGQIWEPSGSSDKERTGFAYFKIISLCLISSYFAFKGGLKLTAGSSNFESLWTAASSEQLWHRIHVRMYQAIISLISENWVHSFSSKKFRLPFFSLVLNQITLYPRRSCYYRLV